MRFPASEALVPELVVLASSPSTNAELASRARRSPLPGFTTVVTDDQTAGRGRLDRSWIAPAGSALAISVLIDPGPLPPERLGWLPIAAGVAMTGVVADLLPGAAVGFKWPNDVLVEARKLAGVLVEPQLKAGRIEFAIVGIGLNLGHRAEDWPAHLADVAVSLRQLGGKDDPGAALDTLCRCLQARYDRALAAGAGSLLGAWEAECGRAELPEIGAPG